MIECARAFAKYGIAILGSCDGKTCVVVEDYVYIGESGMSHNDLSSILPEPGRSLTTESVPVSYTMLNNAFVLLVDTHQLD